MKGVFAVLRRRVCIDAITKAVRDLDSEVEPTPLVSMVCTVNSGHLRFKQPGLVIRVVFWAHLACCEAA
jgi:hypothetical protein